MNSKTYKTREQFTSLYLSQSYQDAWENYSLSLKREDFAVWDYVVLTASNAQQADIFNAQIILRKAYLPSRTKFVVIPDEEGKRVGSGGATLSVLKYLRSVENSFDGLRILVIHSGGDSKRIPQYSALGKLFSPVPRRLPDGRPSTLFDEIFIVMSALAGRLREGMLVISGDVLPLFNPLLVDYSGEGAAAISFKEKVEIATNHGVFLSEDDKSNLLKAFFHKMSVGALHASGAVNARGYVDIDTGAIILGKDILASLYSLISVDGIFSESLYKKFVNDHVRLSLYGDLQYPFASGSTLENYYAQDSEGHMDAALKEVRYAIWQALHRYPMKIIRVAPSKFIHFGTTKEVLALYHNTIYDYQDLAWTPQVNSSIKGDVPGYNAVVSPDSEVAEGCYLEVSYVHRNAHIGKGCVLSYIDIHSDVHVPDDVVLHGLKQNNAKFVCRIYGVEDSAKRNSLFGASLEQFLQKNSLSYDVLWAADEEKSLWNARLYPECDSIKEAVLWACDIHCMILQNDTAILQRWLLERRKSLKEGFHNADTTAILDWNKRMAELVQIHHIYAQIVQRSNAENLLGSLAPLTKIQRSWLEKRLEQSGYMDRMRILYYIGVALDQTGGDAYKVQAFRELQQEILHTAAQNLQENQNLNIMESEVEINLPLRVNWGGGWSDTPPYCMEHGGTVLNAAILLNDSYPVKVVVRRLKEHKIVLASEDMGVYKEFLDIKQLQDVGDPFDSFVLQKAALLACGVLPKEGSSLAEVLQRIGGGIYLNTEVTGVPKGSGLGTSSILSAACVKGLFDFFHLKQNDNDIYEHVLCMEQIMSTGGGWQDQIGGLTPGIKYIMSKPGIQQKLKVETLQFSPQVHEELNERFCLIYTGQRRLARNLLRDVVGRYIGNHPDSLYALNEIQKLAALMRFELEREHVDEFAKLLNQHWELSKMIDSGSSNTLIEQIFDSVADLIDGKMICGAGGGGFLQVILKKGVSKTQLQERLKSIFHDSSIDMWECRLI